MSKFSKRYCHEVRENSLSGGGETGYYRRPHKGNCVFVIWLRQDSHCLDLLTVPSSLLYLLN